MDCHHCYITAPALYPHRAITVPSPHHHRTITAPSPHHEELCSLAAERAALHQEAEDMRQRSDREMAVVHEEFEATLRELRGASEQT